MSENVGTGKLGLTTGIGALMGSTFGVALMENLRAYYPDLFLISGDIQFRFWALGLILIALSMTVIVGFIGGLFISLGSVMFAYDVVSIGGNWLSTLVNSIIVIIIIIVCVYVAKTKAMK